METDVLERLKELASLRVGIDPMPSWLPGFDWGPALSKLAGDAAGEIERLRSLTGKANVGQSFSEMTSELRHQTPSDA